MNAARALVLGAVAEMATTKQIPARIALYRAAAEFAGSPADAKPFLDLAADLEAADRRCHEFAFAFTHSNENGGTR